MFCSACGAKVRDTDSFCWKCGARVGAPDDGEDNEPNDNVSVVQGEGRSDSASYQSKVQSGKAAKRPGSPKADGSSRAKSNNASETSAKVSAGGAEPKRPVITVGEDGTINVSGSKRIDVGAGSNVKHMSASRIDPSAYAGSWRDIHDAVLAAGFALNGTEAYCSDGSSSITLDYRSDAVLSPNPFPDEAIFAMGVPCESAASVGGIDDIPSSIRASWVQLIMQMNDAHEVAWDDATIVERIVAIADFVGFKPQEVVEGGRGSHELTDAFARAFGVSGKALSGEEASRYYDKRKDKRNGFMLKNDAVRLYGLVGRPCAMFRRELTVNSDGFNFVTE